MLGAKVILDSRSNGAIFAGDSAGSCVPVEAIIGDEDAALVLRVARCGE
jgi:hypothetical protein